MKRHFSTVVICGNEMISFEVGQELKVAPTKLDALSLRKVVYDLEKTVTADSLVVLDLVEDLLNKDTRYRLSNVSKNMKVVDSIVYV